MEIQKLYFKKPEIATLDNKSAHGTNPRGNTETENGYQNEFQKHIFQFANVLTNIVTITKTNDCGAVNVGGADAGSDLDTWNDGILEFQAVEISDEDEISTPECVVDPLSDLMVNMEPIRLQIENIHSVPQSPTENIQPMNMVVDNNTPVYACNLCPYTGKHSRHLAIHKRVHKRKRKNRVKLGKKMVYDGSMNSTKPIAKGNNEDNQTHQVPVMKKCPHCPFRTIFNNALGSHMRRKHSTGVLECLYCPFKAGNRLQLRFHMRERHYVKPAGLCGKDTALKTLGETLSTRGRQIRLADSTNAVGRFKCFKCPRTFSEHHNMLRHMRTMHEKRKKKCPYCKKSVLFEFHLRRHMEKSHPELLGRLRQNERSTDSDLLDKNSIEKEENNIVPIKTYMPVGPCTDQTTNKHNCQICHFYTEDINILRLHTLIKHSKRKKPGKGGVVRCLFCTTIFTFRYKMVRHVKTNHHEAWLKLERNTQQSNLNCEESEAKSDGEISSNQSIKNTNSSSKEFEEPSTSLDNASQLSTGKYVSEVLKIREEKFSMPRRYCVKCKKTFYFYYYNRHRCIKLYKCNRCSYTGRNLGKYRSHRRNCRSKDGHEKDALISNEVQEDIGEVKQTCTESNEENNVPSVSKIKEGKFKCPRKYCVDCQKSFYFYYYNRHRCIKLYKCNRCSYTGRNLGKFQSHQRNCRPKDGHEKYTLISNEMQKDIGEVKQTCSESNEQNNLPAVSKISEAKFKCPRKYCVNCQKTFFFYYYNRHQCIKLYKCNRCSYTGRNLGKFQSHQRNCRPKDGHEKYTLISNEMQKDIGEVKQTCSESNEQNNLPAVSKISEAKFKRPRKYCVNCQKTFFFYYYNRHRCIKLYKCNRCSYTERNLGKFRFHRRNCRPKDGHEKDSFTYNEVRNEIGEDKQTCTESNKEIKLGCDDHKRTICVSEKHPVAKRIEENITSTQHELPYASSDKSTTLPKSDSESGTLVGKVSDGHGPSFIDHATTSAITEDPAVTQNADETCSRCLKSYIQQRFSQHVCRPPKMPVQRKTCSRCLKRYNVDYFPNHSCSMKVDSQIEPMVNVAVSKPADYVADAVQSIWNPMFK